MSCIFFISDHHFTHKNILNFAGEHRNDGKLVSVEEHDDWIVERHNSRVKKRDVTYFCGDVSFSEQGLYRLADMSGTKILVRGNHDKFDIKDYLMFFDDVYGLKKYKEFWISHAPIHPQELRGKYNIHGHIHFNDLIDPTTGKQDPRYFNICVEALNGLPIKLDEIRDIFKSRFK